MADGEPPSWIDAALVQEAFRRAGDARVSVHSVTLHRAVPSGDNYNSLIVRVTSETNTGTRSLIVKALPSGDVIAETIKEGRFFERESLMLHDIVPRMHGLLEAAAPGRFPPFSARCFHYEHGDRQFLVLEDLAPQGFRMADRQRGLGLRHSLLAMKTLAYFHVASAAILSQDPTLVEEMPNPYRSIKRDTFRNFSSAVWQAVADACRRWPDSKYADAIEALKDKAFERYAASNDFKPGRFNVIVHGDFWCNNIMMRYEEGLLPCSKWAQDIRFVDLQIAHAATPAVDILYFLYSSVSEDVSTNHLDLLLREYHVTLTDAARLLGLDAPSLTDLRDDLEENGFFATFGAFFVLTVAKTQKAMDFEKSVTEGAAQNDFMYTNETVQRWFRRLIPEFYRKGLLSP